MAHSSLSLDPGVYKSQEARLMLLVYDVQASSTTTLTRMKEEQWSLDGFVRAMLWKSLHIGNGICGFDPNVLL